MSALSIRNMNHSQRFRNELSAPPQMPDTLKAALNDLYIRYGNEKYQRIVDAGPVNNAEFERYILAQATAPAQDVEQTQAVGPTDADIDEAYRVQAKRENLTKRGLSGIARRIIKDDGTKHDDKPWDLQADRRRNRDFNVSSPKNF